MTTYSDLALQFEWFSCIALRPVVGLEPTLSKYLSRFKLHDLAVNWYNF